jgi:hypothetical protein
MWGQRFGGTGKDGASAVALDEAGGIIIGGSYTGQVTFDSTPMTMLTSEGIADLLLFKLTQEGGVAWARGYGSVQTDGIEAVTIGSGGEIGIGGRVGDDIASGPLQMVSSLNNAFLAVMSADAATAISVLPNMQVGPSIALAMAFDPASQDLFAGGSFDTGVEFGMNSEVVTTAEPSDGFLARRSAETMVLRAMTSPATKDVVSAIAVASGALAVGGSCGSDGLLLARPCAPSGNTGTIVVARVPLDFSNIPPANPDYWVKYFGDDMTNSVDALAVDPITDEIIAAGHFGGTVYFDGPQFSAIGGIYIVKLHP